MNGTVELSTIGAERQPGDLIAVAFLWLLWALSVLPLVVLFLEFGGNSPVCVEARYYAKLYGHIFVYPATFGLLATAFLTRPWLHTVRSVRALPPPKRGRVVAFLACAIVGIVTFASWADFTGETPALWSFEAATKHEIEDATIFKACKILKEGRRNVQPTKNRTKPIRNPGRRWMPCRATQILMTLAPTRSGPTMFSSLPIRRGSRFSLASSSHAPLPKTDRS